MDELGVLLYCSALDCIVPEEAGGSDQCLEEEVH